MIKVIIFVLAYGAEYAIIGNKLFVYINNGVYIYDSTNKSVRFIANSWYLDEDINNL